MTYESFRHELVSVLSNDLWGIQKGCVGVLRGDFSILWGDVWNIQRRSVGVLGGDFSILSGDVWDMQSQIVNALSRVLLDIQKLLMYYHATC